MKDSQMKRRLKLVVFLYRDDFLICSTGSNFFMAVSYTYCYEESSYADGLIQGYFRKNIVHMLY